MSLVKPHENPRLEPAPLLSCDQVLPILRSIISQETNPLKHIQFPHVWRHAKIDDDSEFIAFLNEYNQMMENRDATFCKKCNCKKDMSECMDTGRGEIRWFAVQEDTCGVCTNNYCSRCKADDDHFNGIRLCLTCERRYCSKCSTMVECGDCGDMYCVGCVHHNECASTGCTITYCNDCHSFFACNYCGKSWCGQCMNANPIECRFCSKRCCAECSEKEGANGVHSCDECRSANVSSHSLCDKCRVEKCKSYPDCKSCVKIVSALILKENKQLHDETKSLKEENKGLKKEIKEMKEDMSMARIFLNKY